VARVLDWNYNDADRIAKMIPNELNITLDSAVEKNAELKQAIENEPDWNNWSRLTSYELMPLLVNDLESPAYSLRPELDTLRKRLQEEWVSIVRMSGSGSTLFTLCDEGEAAEERAARASAMLEGIRVEVVRLAPSTDI